jgi:hypothetical protein
LTRAKKWVIITEISKEVENNTKQELMRMQGSMYLDEMLPLEDQMPEVVVLDVLESCHCVFIHLFVLK